MNQQETHALYAQAEAARKAAPDGGADADAAHAAATAVWNAWANAMLADRKTLEARGDWQAEKNYRGWQPGNAATRVWMAAATATFSSQEAKWETPGDLRCDGWVFPWHARFYKATFTGDAGFDRATFKENAGFDGATFTGFAGFAEATFTGNSWFNGATFKQIAFFNGVTFTGKAWYNGATFTGDARFGGATFTGNSWFNGATFTGDARFDGATFTGNAEFREATFTGDAWFNGATFTGHARFDEATFTGDAWFNGATFTGDARFGGATFTGRAGFGGATFTGDAGFDKATFTGDAGFDRATFTGSARFGEATFTGDARFTQATFEGFTSFAEAEFRRQASFHAIECKSAFSLANAAFAHPPDFIQAHFSEPARLDNSHIRRSLVEPGRFWNWPVRAGRMLVTRRFDGGALDEPARYRWLKRLASNAKDGDRELAFFAGEVRSARWLTDFPLPLATLRIGAAERGWNKRFLRYLPLNPLSPAAWAGGLRFWFGQFYGLFSDFGRSVFRPLLAWCIVTVIAAGAYLGQQPDVREARARSFGASLLPWATTYTLASWDAWRDGQHCWAGLPDKPDPADRSKTIPTDFSGLRPSVRAQVDANGGAAVEALRLAVANATIIGAQDGNHRMYGCLYGVERFGDNPVAHVPGTVSAIAMWQKIFSALFIFLFGLGVRNMLKMK